MSTKLAAGGDFPAFAWPSVSGTHITPVKEAGWRLIVVYRGKHCPLCKKYLAELNAMQSDFGAAGLQVWALSSDPVERARSEAEAENWTLPILAELSEAQMRELGLYISSPRTPEETDRNFSEPGVFVLNPKGQVQIVDISNAPFVRPDLKGLFGGIKFVKANDYPIRGMVE